MIDGPTHCAALQDTVAILTAFGDLFISSTDLRSWTKTIAPYQFMSLTTYQSQFVLAGGCHYSTSEVTNTLHNSTTGQQWERSLPPMPTKRYETSSVSTRSPEMLIIAGGRNFQHTILDVVEVLQEDKWATVEALPEPDCTMRSTVHEGNLHFTGGCEYNIVYTCNCSSLSSFTSATSTGPLWKIYDAPDYKTTAVSCFSRLTNIDGCGTVTGYCNISQSWLEATSTGHTYHEGKSWDIAATVLTTGDIVYCHKYGGVYRLSLSGENTILFV